MGLEAAGEGCSDPRHALQRLKGTERAAHGAVADYSRRQRRPDPGKRLDFGLRSGVEVHGSRGGPGRLALGGERGTRPEGARGSRAGRVSPLAAKAVQRPRVEWRRRGRRSGRDDTRTEAGIARGTGNPACPGWGACGGRGAQRPRATPGRHPISGGGASTGRHPAPAAPDAAGGDGGIDGLDLPGKSGSITSSGGPAGATQLHPAARADAERAYCGNEHQGASLSRRRHAGSVRPAGCRGGIRIAPVGAFLRGRPSPPSGSSQRRCLGPARVPYLTSDIATSPITFMDFADTLSMVSQSM